MYSWLLLSVGEGRGEVESLGDHKDISENSYRGREGWGMHGHLLPDRGK